MRFFLFEVTETEISDPINAIDNKNSSSDAFISDMLIETFGLTPVLAALVNQKCEQTKFPSIIARAKFSPLFKNGCTCDISYPFKSSSVKILRRH